MTNYERIRSMMATEMAVLLIYESPFDYVTPDGYRFERFEDAVEHTWTWLRSDFVEGV